MFMDYEIESYAGVGPIRLGMSREEVRKAVMGPVKEVEQTFFANLSGSRSQC
jgi:hypothetical protein